MRFKKTEEQIKGEQEKIEEKRAAKEKKLRQIEQGIESPPVNRHGRLVPNGVFISPITYKLQHIQLKAAKEKKLSLTNRNEIQRRVQVQEDELSQTRLSML